MGADIFKDWASGRNCNEAFKRARKQAEYDYGHDGYTGSIAEKENAVAIKDTPTAVLSTVQHHMPNINKYVVERLQKAIASGDRRDQVEAVADVLIEIQDSRIDDKWGPAGCIEIGSSTKKGEKEYLLFGWASS